MKHQLLESIKISLLWMIRNCSFLTFPENRPDAILQIQEGPVSMFILTHDGTRTVWLLRPGAGNQEQRRRSTITQ